MGAVAKRVCSATVSEKNIIEDKFMNEELCMNGVRVIDARTRVEGVRSAFRIAVQALDRGLYDSLSVVSPNRQLSFGYDLGWARGSISLLAASNHECLNEWLLDWQTTRSSFESLRVKRPAANISLSLGEAVGYSEWCGDDLLRVLFERGSSTLHIWDLGNDDGNFLPCINGEAVRRGICILVVRTSGHEPWSNGEILPNLEEISVYERCLALIRTEGRISPSMIQRFFGLSWTEAACLMQRLANDGVLKDSTEGDVVYEVVWKMVPKGPSLG